MRQTTGIILLEVLTGAVLFVGMIAALVAWRLVSGPTDIGFLKGDVESAFAQARDGRGVEIGQLRLQWIQSKTEFKIVAETIRFLGADGQVVGTAEQAQLDLNAVSLLAGRIELSEMWLDTGSLSVERNRNGEIRVADHIIPPFDPSLLPPDPTPVQIANFSIGNVLRTLQSNTTIRKLDRLSFRNFIVTFKDESLLLDWTIEDAELDIRRNADQLDIMAAGLPHGDGAPDTATFETRLDLGSGRFHMVTSLRSLPVTALPFLSELPVKVSGRLSSDITLQAEYDGTEIVFVSTTLSTKPGELLVDDAAIRFGSNDITFAYDIPGNAFELDGRAVDVSAVKGTILIRLPDAEAWLRTPAAKHAIIVNSPDLQLDFRPMFETPLTLRDSTLSGVLDLQKGKLTYDSARIDMGGFEAVSTGELYLSDRSHPKDLIVGLRLTAKTEGGVSSRQVLRFWPVRLGSGAREWVSSNVRAGELYDADFYLNLTPDALRDNTLENDDLKLDFSFRNAEIAVLSDLPTVRDATGRARLEGNRFSLDMSDGRFSNWTITNGLVQIPRFQPGGETLSVKAQGTGKVRDMLATLSQSRLQLEEKYGLRPDAVSGEGEAEFTFTRPLLNSVPDDANKFRVDGKIRNGGFENLFSDLGLSQANAVLIADNTQLRVNGYGELLNTPVQFDWVETFDPKDQMSTRLTASGNVTPDLLNRYGLSARAYLTGDVFTRMKASGKSLASLDRIDLDLDLTPNRLDFSELGWVKPAGKNGVASVRYRSKEADQRTAVRISADGFDFDGLLSLSDTGMVRNIKLNRLFVDRQLDVAGELSRLASGGLSIDVTGPFVNASPYLDGLMSSSGGISPMFGEVLLRSRIDRVQLKDGLELSGVDLSADFSGPQLKSLSLTGVSPDGGDIDLSLTGGEPQERNLKIAVSDAGGLLEGLFGMDFVEGGSLTANGVLRDGEAGSADLVVAISNARLKNAPLLTQVLSLASLRGLADVMSGDGILFTDIRLPVQIDQRGYYLKGAKASGPAMGFTATGHIMDNGKNVALDGVLVPSFGVNSALGGIPIIGDLFVSRDGEGVFAITYGVRGSLSEARVSINPLSGLLPGVLRRLFENPAEEPLPFVPDDPDVPVTSD